MGKAKKPSRILRKDAKPPREAATAGRRRMVKVEEAKAILKELGLPPAQHNEMAGYTLLALCRLGPKDKWVAARRESVGVTKGVMDYTEAVWGKKYAPNTRETFRRFVLHQLVEARVADYNPDNPKLPTNSPRAHYAITPPALRVVQAYGTPAFAKRLARFKEEQGALIERYKREREGNMVPVRLPDGKELKLSPGTHNEVGAAVINAFAPRFAPGALVLYLGDSADKNAHVDAEYLGRLGVPSNAHGKLPDVVLYDEAKDWLYLVEIAASHGPVDHKRWLEMEALLKRGGCKAGRIYVSAFPTFAEFRRHAGEIAWETEVWVAENPSHLIHYNGDRFMGPR